MASRQRGRTVLTPLAVVLCATVGLASLGLPWVGAQRAVAVERGEYEQVWQAQTLYSGGAGSTKQQVMESVVEMRKNGPVYAGTVEFSDLLGVVSGGKGAVSQESLIELNLDGETLEAGRAAGGTFSGVVTLILRDAVTLGEACDSGIRSKPGEVAVYNVQGHWGATIERDDSGAVMLEGELLYEFADGPTTPADVPAFFNRSNLASPGGLGDGQLFSATAEITSMDGDDGGTVIVTGPASGEPVAGSSGPTLAEFFAYILKGITEPRDRAALHIPDAQARAAQALLDSSPRGATPLPSSAIAIDVHLPGHYLDAKNVAAGVQHGDHDFTGISSMRLSVPGIPAMPVDQDAGMVWAGRATSVLSRQGAVSGTSELIDEIALVRPGSPSSVAGRVRTWYHVGISTLESPFGSVLAPTFALAAQIAETPIEDGAAADAVLAAIDDSAAPLESVQVVSFSRDDSQDAPAAPEGGTAVGRALAAAGSQGPEGLGLDLATSAGPERIAPERWLAYERNDGTWFWLAGSGGDRALTDASIRGWAFVSLRTALVDADRCGRWLDLYTGG